jgi:hypothetical protein
MLDARILVPLVFRKTDEDGTERTGILLDLQDGGFLIAVGPDAGLDVKFRNHSLWDDRLTRFSEERGWRPASADELSDDDKATVLSAIAPHAKGASRRKARAEGLVWTLDGNIVAAQDLPTASRHEFLAAVAGKTIDD